MRKRAFALAAALTLASAGGLSVPHVRAAAPTITCAITPGIITDTSSVTSVTLTQSQLKQISRAEVGTTVIIDGLVVTKTGTNTFLVNGEPQTLICPA